MERTIKFRAWDKELCRMLTGINQYGADEPDFNREYSSAGAFTRLWEALARFKESERFILMQYTGLKDSEGKEEYESDYVEFYPCEEELAFVGIAVVEWAGSGFACKPVQCDNPGGLDSLDSTMFWYEQTRKVIGNLYENPELLEEK